MSVTATQSCHHPDSEQARHYYMLPHSLAPLNHRHYAGTYLFVMCLTTKMDEITGHTSEASFSVGSTVQSLRLVKNFVDMLHGRGELLFAHLRGTGKTGHVMSVIVRGRVQTRLVALRD